MSKQEVQTVIEKASEIEKLLSPTGGSFMPDLKTIHTKEEFLRWKEELRHHIQKLKPAPLVVDILHLLENGFKNGFTAESNRNWLLTAVSVFRQRITNTARLTKIQFRFIRMLIYMPIFFATTCKTLLLMI